MMYVLKKKQKHIQPTHGLFVKFQGSLGELHRCTPKSPSASDLKKKFKKVK